MKLRTLAAACGIIFISVSASSISQTKTAISGASEYMEMLSHAISIPSAQGTEAGNLAVQQVADYLASKLESAGFSKSDVSVIPVKDAGGNSYVLVATYQGSDRSLKPIYFNGHMDVVSAGDPSRWTDDKPYALIKRGNFYYGRGVADMKNGTTALVYTFMRLKQRGFIPKRTMMLLLSGDEETTFNGARYLADHYHDGEFLVDADGGSGMYGPEEKPLLFGLGVSEKTNMDFLVRATSPGGHSSIPSRANAIYYLSAAMTKVGAYQFPVKHMPATLNEIKVMGKLRGGDIGHAMEAFASDPSSQHAVAAIESNQFVNGMIHTTCVATIIRGGVPFARNALPEAAEANVNCRAWPGETADEVRSTLGRVIADGHITVTTRDTTTKTSPESVVIPSVRLLTTQLVHRRFPGIPIVDSMSLGASDAQFWRKRGVPAYGIAPVFTEHGGRAHDFNERLRISEIEPSLAFWNSFMRGASQ